MINLKDHRIVAIIRADSTHEAISKTTACIDGGIRVIEITFSFPKCSEVIKNLKDNHEIIVGAGTVLNIEDAGRALDSGADFIVSPHTDADIINFSRKNNKFVISGASTSNEIVNAYNLGANMIKIFPANLIGGPKYVKAIKEPLPFAEIFVTGGINIDNCAEYLSSGASLIGVASALFSNPQNMDGEKIIEINARKFIEKLQHI
jgi:2-dehydro-3-deoxyphosphogluconate aldolase/(4S)-4-hydroxy-2-oxoglutarate aldolase